MFDVRRIFAALRRPAPCGPFERGVAAHARGDHALALTEFTAATGVAADAEARAASHNKRGVVLVSLDRRTDALQAFCAALACHERSAPALVNIGNLLLEEEAVLDAVDYFEAALRADDKYALGYRNLGIALKRLGRRPEAVRAFRAAARLEARQPRGRA